MNNQLAKTNGNDFQIIPLNDFDRSKYNSLMPMSVGELSEVHSVRYFSVTLSPDPRDGDVYPESGQLALRKRALEQLADAAGVIWDTRNCKRLDDMKDDDVVIFQVVGGITRPDGTIKAVTGTKEINLRDLAKNEMSPAQIKQIRLHKTRLAETKAYLAALRSLLKIKSTYTADELRKPFVVAQVYVDPAKDPDVRRMLRARAVQDMHDLFGPAQAAPAMPALPAPTEQEIDDEPFDPPAELPGEPTADAIPPVEAEEATKADLRRKIEAIAVEAKISNNQIEAWCKKNLEGTTYAEASLDGLTALRDALAAKTSKTGKVT